jgi:hypothetical protein
MEKHVINVANAERMWGWLQTRGGIAVWPSIDLSDLGKSWSTPANQEDGTPTTKPHWKSGSTPRIITDPAEVEVSVDREVKRFHIGVRMGAQGLALKVTDGGTRRIRKEVAKAGLNAYYEFDYSTQEAVIFASDKVVPLAEYIAKLEKAS